MDLEIHYADEWAALYVDGKLDRVGDTYLAEEKALALTGVTRVFDDAFMRGQQGRDGVAPTLDDVVTYRTAREQAVKDAEALEQQAKELLERARLLRTP